MPQGLAAIIGMFTEKDKAFFALIFAFFDARFILMDSKIDFTNQAATLAETTWGNISPFFSPDELLSPDTTGQIHLIDWGALAALNLFRLKLNIPIMVNFGPHRRRGLRSAREQIQLQRETKNAAELSMHVTGKAFDISSPGVKPEHLAQAAIAFGFSAVGFYPTFVHVDMRTRWQGQKQVIFRKD